MRSLPGHDNIWQGCAWKRCRFHVSAARGRSILGALQGGHLANAANQRNLKRGNLSDVPSEPELYLSIELNRVSFGKQSTIKPVLLTSG